MSSINWTYKHFHDLTADELYAIMHLRSEVFVVEQNCVYLDADGKDQHCFHLCGWDYGKLTAYARVLPPGLAFREASIGRVVTSPAARKTGAGRELMNIAIQKTCEQFNIDEISIGAQLYLLNFYNSLGFIPSGPEYLEDGIPHIEMKLVK